LGFRVKEGEGKRKGQKMEKPNMKKNLLLLIFKKLFPFFVYFS
jgi:hypothetical protein